MWRGCSRRQILLTRQAEIRLRKWKGLGHRSANLRGRSGLMTCGREQRFLDERKEHKSLATIITQKRLEYLNKSQAEKIYFDIRSTEPSGTLVSFSIPLKDQ